MENILNNQGIKEIFDRASDASIKEKELYKDMGDISKDYAKSRKIEHSSIMKVKDYIYYRGNGWGEDSIMPETDEKGKKVSNKYPDRASKVFRRLLECVNSCKAVGKLDILDVYINDLKKYGINISIDYNDGDKCSDNAADDIFDRLCSIQGEICETADIIKEDCLPEAVDKSVCTKRTFRPAVKLYSSLISNKNNKKSSENVENKCNSLSTGYCADLALIESIKDIKQDFDMSNE